MVTGRTKPKLFPISSLLLSVFFVGLCMTLVLLKPSEAFAQTATVPSGSGTSSNPYQVASLENLYWLSQNSSEWSKYYEQTAEIDASETSAWDDGDGGDPEGFSPIGNTTTSFTGTYNGGGHTITGLYINRPSTDNIGLFGYIEDATISNLGLLNVDITGDANTGGLAGKVKSGSGISGSYTTGSVSGSESTGGLVGYNVGTISGSHSSVNVSGTDEFTGGLVGLNSESITTSYAAGTVTNTGYGAGGLVGYNGFIGNSATIMQSYATGNVTISGSEAGGLAGFNNGTVSNSYATGNVTAPLHTGGLIGNNYGGSVNNSYSTGTVSGASQTGGFIGINLVTINGGYWDTETSGTTTGIGQNDKPSQTATGLASAEMKLQSSFSGFDFDDTWALSEGSTFPYLQNTKHRSGGPEISGSESWHMYGSPFVYSTFGTLTDNLWTQGFTGASYPDGNATLYTWDEASQNWATPGSIDSELAAGRGFLVYVFEDDEYETPGTQGGFPKSIVASGQVNTLPQTLFLDYSNGSTTSYDGLNLVANPSASTLDWEQLSGSNVGSTYYVWDPVNEQYDTYQSGVGGTNGGTRYIAPFQGFLVQANGSSASLTVDSTAVSSTETGAYKQAPPQFPEQQEVYSLLLHLENTDGLNDELRLVVRREAQQQYDDFDAPKLTALSGRSLSLGSLLSDSLTLTIDSRSLEETVLNFELAMQAMNTSGEVVLSIIENSLPDDWDMALVDSETGQTIPLRDTPSYAFTLHQIQTEKKANVDPSSSAWTPMNPINVQSQAKGKAASSRFVIRIVPSRVSIGDGSLPTSFALDQNYPNPFNPATVIRYQLPVNSEVRLQVFDILGRKVAALIDGRMEAGYHQVAFDARNLASGVYIYRLVTGGDVFTKKLTVTK